MQNHRLVGTQAQVPESVSTSLNLHISFACFNLSPDIYGRKVSSKVTENETHIGNA